MEATERREGLLVPTSIYRTIRRGDLGSKSIEDLGRGKNAIQENNWKVDEIMGIEEVEKEVDGNFI